MRRLRQVCLVPATDLPPPQAPAVALPTEAAGAVSAERGRGWLKLAAALLVAAGLVVAYRAGVVEMFSEPARVKQTLVGLGGLGYLAFIVAYALLQPFGVPGTVFILVAPLIWPWPVAFVLSMAGTMAASVVGFSFARFIARGWVARRVPARLRAYDQALAQRSFLTVFTLRLIFWMPPMLHVFFGISQVRFWTHFWGSLAGYVLPLLVTAYFGERVFTAMRHVPAAAWVGLAAVLVVAVAVWFLRRMQRRHRIKVMLP